jgi:hypothetical protein
MAYPWRLAYCYSMSMISGVTYCISSSYFELLSADQAVERHSNTAINENSQPDPA